jgi:hypothetical protein
MLFAKVLNDLVWPKRAGLVCSAWMSKAAIHLNGNTGPNIRRRSIDKYAYFGISN